MTPCKQADVTHAALLRMYPECSGYAWWSPRWTPHGVRVDQLTAAYFFWAEECDW